MRPEDRQISSGDPRGNIQAPVRADSANQTAAANIARSQLDSIYSGQSVESTNELPNTYRRTHDSQRSSHADQWQQYHTAWQDYYRKYYEQYYVGAVQQVHKAYSEKSNQSAAPSQSNSFTAGEPDELHALGADVVSALVLPQQVQAK